MATARFTFQSECLARTTDFFAILPNDMPEAAVKDNPHYARPTKTLILLHGYTGHCMDWVYGSTVQELSGKYNIAVICPNGENSFYLDHPATGRKYATHVGRELVDYARKTFGLSGQRSDTAVGGLSMGGFGAIHTALQFNHTFGKCFALSSALITHEVAAMKPGSDNGMSNYEYYELMFGDPKKLLDSENNPETLVKKHLKSGDLMPKFFLACDEMAGRVRISRARQSAIPGIPRLWRLVCIKGRVLRGLFPVKINIIVAQADHSGAADEIAQTDRQEVPQKEASPIKPFRRYAVLRRGEDAGGYVKHIGDAVLIAGQHEEEDRRPETENLLRGRRAADGNPDGDTDQNVAEDAPQQAVGEA